MKNTFKTLIIVVMSLTLTKGISQKIEVEFNYESKFMKINGHQLHYIDDGEGDPILFLHGVPMSSYSWRNFIPHLSEDARCLAIDFMGFGKSDKPDINYSYDDQYGYLSAFIDKLELKNITLVMTDVGGILGQKYARLHPENIKGMAFMETPLTDAVTFQKKGTMMQKMMFWMGGKDKMGYRMFVKKNMFIKMMGMLIKRKLSKEEKEVYAAPYKTEISRLPLFTLVNAYPRKGKNVKEGDMADYMNKNAAWLVNSNHQKLILAAKPGMLMNKKVIKWSEDNLKNTKIEYIGKAKHLMEEDLPHEIGEAVKSWMID